MKSIVRLLASMILAIALAAGTAASASAKPYNGEEPEGSGSGSVCSINGTFDYQYLPVERWSGATQTFHIRTNDGLAGIPTTVFRGLQVTNYIIGDFLYDLTVKVVTWSTQFCPLKAVGGAVDEAAAGLGKALLNSALIAGLVIITIIVLLVQGVRSGGSEWAKRLLAKVAVLALFGIMVAGSTGSTGGGIDGDDGEYDPGMGSPGWFATTIDNVITQLAASPASALSSQAILDVGGKPGDELSCAAYLAALQEGYTDVATKNAVLRSEAVPALTVSNLWQISSYNAWSVSQFGNKNMAGQERVACRMLDINANIPVGVGSFLIDGVSAEGGRSAASVVAVMARVPEKDTGLTETGDWVKKSAPAWRHLPNAEADKAWIAWATCVPKDNKIRNLVLEDGWSTRKETKWLIHDENARENSERVDGSEKLNDACYKFFNNDSTEVDNIFDWGAGEKEIRKFDDVMPASNYNFLTSLHGANVGAGGAAGISYVVSAIGVAAVYGVLGVAILLVKIMAVVMLFSVFFALTMVLFANADNQKLLRFTKEYVGLSLMAAFAVFIMALVTLFVKIIWMMMANFTGGPNSIMTMLLGGLAPVLAAIALHRAFKAIGMPSPMTLKGATSWGQALAGGAAGGAVAVGIEKMTAGAKSLGRRAGGAATGRIGDSIKSKKNAGKRNADISSPQKSGPVAAPTAEERTAEDIAQDPKSTPAEARAAMDEIDQRQNKHERVLANPNSKPDEKRSAQRELRKEHKAIKKEQKEAKTAEGKRVDAAKTKRRNERDKMTPEERWQARGAALAGHLSALPGRSWSAMKDRGLDAKRWAKSAVRNPKASLKKAGAVAGMAGVVALLGAPGIAVVGGALAAKGAKSLITRKVRSHSDRKRQLISDYRRRQAAEAKAAAEAAAAEANNSDGDDPPPPPGPTAGRSPAPARPPASPATPVRMDGNWVDSVGGTVLDNSVLTGGSVLGGHDPRVGSNGWPRMDFDRDKNKNRDKNGNW